jgi:hypothetical protein
MLKGTVVVALLGTAFVLGGQYAALRALWAHAHVAVPAAASSPSHPTAPPQVPPRFTRQLQQPATVTPAPGAPAPGAPRTSGFGLED